MRWLLSACDRLIGTAIGAVAGVSASQTQAFIHAYLQRLGGHLDEARASYLKLRAGEFLPGADALSQQRMAEAFSRRVEELSQAYNAIANADALVQPLRFARHMDRTIAEATFSHFTPALPLDSASLIYALAGMVLGLLIYEIIKLPLRPFRRRRHAY